MTTIDGAARSGGNWNRLRIIAYWATTLVIALELAAGSVWNLVPIDWIVAQLRHLGYPAYFAYILGVWQLGAAVAIVVPRFALLKEWAYAGSFFLWSGAVASHLIVGDGPALWGVPLTFGVLAVASWLLRPAGRRLPQTRLRRHGGDAGPAGEGHRRARRDWTAAIGLLVVLFAIAVLTLPAVEPVMYERAVDLGWIE